MALPTPMTPVSRRTIAENLSSDELNKWMQKEGISEKELSQVFGVTIQAVKLWLTGERKFSVTNTRLVKLFMKYPKLFSEF